MGWGDSDAGTVSISAGSFQGNGESRLSTSDSSSQPEFELKCSELGLTRGCVQKACILGLNLLVFENSYAALP